jgi:5S rRNA maturation endonuclease (ribonuclease M5)
MIEGHRDALRIKNLFIKDVIEMCSHENFRTVRASVQEVAKDTTEQASTICR